MTMFAGPWDDPTSYIPDDRYQRFMRAVGRGVGGVFGSPGGPEGAVAANGAATGFVVQPFEVGAYGRYAREDQVVTVSPVAADTQPRIDRLVVRFNRTAGLLADRGKLTILKGTPAANPAAPALLADPDGTFDVPLARGRVSPTAPTLSQVTDERRFAGIEVIPCRIVEDIPTVDLRKGTVAFEDGSDRWRGWDGATWSTIYDPAAEANWQVWSPTFSNLTLANGSIVAAWRQVGKTIHFRLTVIFGSLTAIGQGSNFTLPVPPAGAQVGTAGFYHASTDAYVGGSVFLQPTNAGIALPISHLGRTSGTSPFDWAVGDILAVAGTYETP